MSEPTGPFKVILTAVDESWNSRLRSEVSRLFQIDDETASNIVSAIPIVVLDGLDARAAGVVRDRMRGLVEAGCRVVTTDDPADTIPRVNWPEMPEIGRIPAEEPRQVITVHDHGGKAPPLSSFSCPGCGQVFNIAAAGRLAESRDQVGALVGPGAGAPSGGAPGKSVPVAAQASSGGTSHAGPTNGTEKRHAPTAAAEPGAKLAGDDWLDPPLTDPGKKPAEAKPFGADPRPAERAAPKPLERTAPKPIDTHEATAPTQKYTQAERPTPKLAPMASAPVAATPVAATPVAAAPPPPPPVVAPVAVAEKKPSSLLDDPLLAAKRFDTQPNAEHGPAFSSTGEPTTLVARPITNRFMRSVVPQPGAAATPAPLPTPRPSGVASPGTGRFGPPAVPSPSNAGAGSGRFAPPPPAQATPAAGTSRGIPPTRGFGGNAAPVPPPSQFASLDSTTSNAKGASGKSAKKGSTPSSPLDEDELDVHFDEASDIQAVEKLDKPGKKKGKSIDDDDDLTPAGMDEDDFGSLLDDDDLDDSRTTKKAASAAREASSKHASRDSDDEDLLAFDELDSQGPTTKAPKAKKPVDGDDGSFDGGRIDELLDGDPPATVSPGKKPARDVKPLLDSNEEEEEEELLLDDEEPKAKKPKPVLDSQDDDDEALSDRSLFGASDDARPALKSAPAGKDKPAPAKPTPKSKLPRESGFADALDMFEDEDEEPLDADPVLAANSKSQADDDEQDVPEIKPLDLASDVQGIPPPRPGKSKKPESPFDRPSSSAILEPLDPNEAMAILKTHQNDDPGLADSGDRPPSRKSAGAGSAGTLEPLDPNDALAILATPDERKGGKTPPRKPTRQKNGRQSDASKLVPLSASDEDFAFLEPGKGKGGGAGKGADKGTDPFARAKKPPSGDKQPAVSSGKKRSDPYEKAAPSKMDSDDDSDSLPRPSKRTEPSTSQRGGGGGGGGASTKVASSNRRGGAVPEGAGECGLVLPRIATESKREKAAELISEIKGVGVDEAKKLTERTIIPVLTGVSRDVAEFHREKFERNKISARVTTRSAKEK